MTEITRGHGRSPQPAGRIGGTSPTLRISRRVVEDYPPFIVVHHLEELKVASAIRQRPEARLVVVQDGARVALREIPPK